MQIKRGTVTAVRRLGCDGRPTYNLNVTPTHNYFANGVLVHNCVDDPTSVDQADSDAERNTANEWWLGTMSTRLNSQKTGHFVVIQQRLHEEDLTGVLMGRGTGYEFLILQE